MACLLAAGCNQLFGLEPGESGGTDGRPGDVDAPFDDDDADGVPNGIDNCRTIPNPRQADEDGDAEINGGDACDLCPHRGSVPAGQPHANLDLDALGDECDPNNQVRHCMRWFDGFSGDPGAVLARYERTGTGTWAVEGGALKQIDAAAEAARVTIAGGDLAAPYIATQGVMDVLPTQQTGGFPYRNTAGVIGGYRGGVSGACFASVSRDIAASTPGAATATLAFATQVSEIVAGQTAFAPAGTSMVAGERFSATLDVLDATMPTSTGVLPDRGSAAMSGGMINCTGGSAGLRTSFAAISFDYLLVVEVEPMGGCGI